MREKLASQQALSHVGPESPSKKRAKSPVAVPTDPQADATVPILLDTAALSLLRQASDRVAEMFTGGDHSKPVQARYLDWIHDKGSSQSEPGGTVTEPTLRATEGIADVLNGQSEADEDNVHQTVPLDLDTSVFRLVRQATEAVAHAPDPEGVPRETLPVDFDPAVVGVAKHVSDAIFDALGVNGEDGQVPVTMDTSLNATVRRMTESFLEAISDPELGSAAAGDIDIECFEKMNVALHRSDTVRRMSEHVRDMLEDEAEEDEANRPRTLEKAWWVL